MKLEEVDDQTLLAQQSTGSATSSILPNTPSLDFQNVEPTIRHRLKVKKEVLEELFGLAVKMEAYDLDTEAKSSQKKIHEKKKQKRNE